MQYAIIDIDQLYLNEPGINHHKCVLSKILNRLSVLVKIEIAAVPGNVG